MPFFNDARVVSLLESNIAHIEKLSEKEQKKLLSVFKETRRELQDRLLVIPSGTFSEQQLNVVLIQVQAAIDAISQELKSQMIDSSKIISKAGISRLIKEIESFSSYFEHSIQPLSIDRVLIATEANNFLINKYKASLDAYSQSLRSQITSNIVKSMAVKDNHERAVYRLVTNIGKFFIGEEWKIRRIVRTELSNIYNYSKMKTMSKLSESAIPKLKKSLYHPIDHRTGEDSKLLNAKNPILDINKPFVFKYKGKTRTFQFPPDRPNDRSVLIPIKKSWV